MRNGVKNDTDTSVTATDGTSYTLVAITGGADTDGTGTDVLPFHD
jgi:hypothetical protein